MTQDERWMVRYQEVKNFIETNHRNPSKYKPEEKKCQGDRSVASELKIRVNLHIQN